MKISKKKSFSSRYTGVSLNVGRWRAYITTGGKLLQLGTYGTEEEAAQAYNAAAVKFRGDKAELNVISTPVSYDKAAAKWSASA